ncbi:MAG: hypothetical protein QM666_03465 [Acinetobacter sp.]
MNKLLFSSILIAYSSLAMAAQPQTPVTTNSNADDITIVVKPQIAGLWKMPIPDNKKCVEYYNFKSGNQVIIKSANEWSTGVYEYQPSPNNKELGALALQVKYDNNQKDCSGRVEDQTGEISQYFVKWQDQSTIQFCTSEALDRCIVTLHRVLP